MIAFVQAHIIEIGIAVIVLTYAVPYLGKLKGVIPAKKHMSGASCVSKLLEVESALQEHGAEATADKLAYLIPEVVKACRKDA